jgi:hypothetical protein
VSLFSIRNNVTRAGVDAIHQKLDCLFIKKVNVYLTSSSSVLVDILFQLNTYVLTLVSREKLRNIQLQQGFLAYIKCDTDANCLLLRQRQQMRQCIYFLSTNLTCLVILSFKSCSTF